MSNKRNHIKCPRNYGELHSISTIEKVYAKCKTGDSVIIGKILSYYILSHNLKQIIHLDLKKDIETVIKRFNWLNFFVQSHRSLNSQLSTIDLTNSVWIDELFEVEEEFISNYKLFDNYLFNVITKDQINISKLLHKEEFHTFKLFVTSIPNIMADDGLKIYIGSTKSQDSLKAISIIDSSSISHIGFVTEFRVLHQLQELYFNDINFLLKNSIELIKEKHYIDVVQNLMQIKDLFELTNEANFGLLNNLSVTDYHHFRDYLGASSGIQSNAICVSNFRKLYPMFSSVVEEFILKEKESKWFQLICNLSKRISDSLNIWKEIHLLFPMNYLGGSNSGYGTSSMLGIKDGLKTVQSLLKSSYEKDLLLKHYSSNRDNSPRDLPTKIYSLLLKSTGALTQKKFPEVQNRAYSESKIKIR